MEENTIEIELLDDIPEEHRALQLPVNFQPFGEIEPDDVKVYIKQDIYQALEKLAHSNTDKELGSILLGSYSQELGKTHVVISAYIEAKYTDASASTLTFTHETWEYIHAEHQKRYPDLKIIGWQHTHPNYGIFLSNYDMFIQENFFNLPFQIAYVIDPIQDIRGFFQWKNEKIVKLQGYYIYDDMSRPIKIAQKKEKTATSGNSSKWMAVALGIMAVALIGLVGFALCLNGKIKDRAKEQKEVFELLENQQLTISQQEQAIAQLEAQHAQAPAAADVAALEESLNQCAQEIVRQEQVISAQADTIAQLQQQMEQAPDTVAFRVYTVQSGDTLYGICQAHGLDYGKNIQYIMTLNNIQNPRFIREGQILLIPIA